MEFKRETLENVHIVKVKSKSEINNILLECNFK